VASDAADSILAAGHITPSTVSRSYFDYPNYNNGGIRVIGLQLQKPFNWAFNGPMTMQGGASVSKTALNLQSVTYMKTETFK